MTNEDNIAVIAGGKLRRNDGKIGIIISRPHGGGWWDNRTEGNNNRVKDANIALLIFEGKMREAIAYCQKTYGNSMSNCLEDAELVWLDEGTPFIIEEYDGAEELTTLNDLDIKIA